MAAQTWRRCHCNSFISHRFVAERDYAATGESFFPKKDTMLLYVPSGGEMGSSNTGLYGAESFIGNEKKKRKVTKIVAHTVPVWRRPASKEVLNII